MTFLRTNLIGECSFRWQRSGVAGPTPQYAAGDADDHDANHVCVKNVIPPKPPGPPMGLAAEPSGRGPFVMPRTLFCATTAHCARSYQM